MLLPRGVVLDQKKNQAVDDIMKRIKTTSQHLPKFAEALEILLDLLVAEHEQLLQKHPALRKIWEARHRSLSRKHRLYSEQLALLNPATLRSLKIRNMIREPQNYKVFIKAFTSKNQAVQYAIHKVVSVIWGLDHQDVVQLFHASKASTALIDQYRKGQNAMTRMQVMDIIIPLLEAQQTDELAVGQ